MARPTKQGVDYFPLDVHMDDKFKFIEIKYGLEGFAIVIKLMQRIYSLGYWCKWTEDEMLLFSDEIREDCETVKNVVSECLKRNIFNEKLHNDYGILTSKGIQKRYKEIVRRRKDVEVVEDYLLIDNISRVNDVIKSSRSKHNDNKSTQSKVKESKGKDIKEKYLDNVYLKPSEYKRLVSDYTEKDIDSKIEDLDTYISNKGKNPYKDHNKTIRNWLKRDGVKSNKEKEELKQSKKPTTEEKIDELDGLLELGKDYFEMNGNPERYDELIGMREELERQL